MSRFVLLGGAAASLCALAAPIAAHAAASREEIIVTASRIDEPAYAVGGSYSVVTGEELEQRQTQFIADALRAVPGLAVNRSGGFGAQTQLRIRGAESNMTLVLIDGVKVNAPADFGNDFDFGNLVALDVDRIEVLRGAQSSIWGANAIGGVVNIVTKDPEPGFHGLASAEGGSFDTTSYRARLAYGGEKFAASLGGTLFHSNGISQADVKFGAARERDGNRNGSANGRLRLTPSDNLVITLDGRYINSKLGTDSSPPFDSPDETHLNERWGNATIDWTLFGGHVRNIATASVLDVKSGSGDNAGSFFTNSGSKDVFSDQVNLTGDTNFLLPASHRLTFLVEYERDAGISSFSSNRVTENRGYVAEYSVGLFDQLFLSASARRDDNNRFANTWTYRGTASFRIPSTGTRFHGSYGTGVESPTFGDIFGFPGFSLPNLALQPETSRSADFGIEQRLFANRLKLDATLFQNRIDNRISVGFNGSAFQSDNVSGRTKIEGIELTATALITADLTVDASYTAMATADPGGAELIRRPRNTGSVYLNYALPQWKANLNLGVVYNGRSRDTDFCAPNFGTGSCDFFPTKGVDLRGFTLVTLAGSYDVTPHIQLHARVENALDQRYEQVIYYGSPRIAAFGGVTVKFGD
jgi:vitamin B12 transporter